MNNVPRFRGKGGARLHKLIAREKMTTKIFLAFIALVVGAAVLMVIYAATHP